MYAYVPMYKIRNILCINFLVVSFIISVPLMNQEPNFTKTGTTIVGLKYKNGVILASDTRSTSGPVVADKNIHKLHYITDNIYACGAGTAADTDRVTLKASTELNLFTLKYNVQPKVAHCVRFLRNYLHGYQGQIGAALIIAGYDGEFDLCQVTPNGYTSSSYFTSMGSGSLAATGVLESKYKIDMEKEEAKELAVEAVKAGIMNDLYSGSNVDLCIITETGAEILRNYCVIAKREDETKLRKYPLNSLSILREEIVEMIKND